MNVEIQTVPAKARCYKCGSPDIKGICHHCGRGVCEDHSHIKLPVRLGLWNTLLVGLGIKSLDHKDFSGYEPGFSRLKVREEILMNKKIHPRKKDPESRMGMVPTDHDRRFIRVAL